MSAVSGDRLAVLTVKVEAKRIVSVLGIPAKLHIDGVLTCLYVD